MAGRLVIGLALALAVGGCAGTAAGDGRPAGAPAVQDRWESCAVAQPGGLDGAHDALGLQRLDDSFQPVAAVVCLAAPAKRAGGGTDLIAGEQRADDIAALVAALRLPDQSRTGGACTMDLPFVPWLALLDAQGRWIRPGIPADACGKPRREFRDAYQAVKMTPVATRPVREIESDEAASAGCEQRWADMVWVTGEWGGGRSSAPAAGLPADDAEVRVCFYRVPADQRGNGKPAGEFEKGGRLPAAKWTTVKREVAAAAPAAACATPATRFALVRLPAGEIYVEADGCRRVLLESRTAQSAALLKATPALAAQLF
jgi:hypothetical protein